MPDSIYIGHEFQQMDGYGLWAASLSLTAREQTELNKGFLALVFECENV